MNDATKAPEFVAWLAEIAGAAPDRTYARKKPVLPIRIDGGTAFIPLTNGNEAIIDASDAHLVAGIRWRSRPSRRKDGTLKTIYACADDYSCRGRRVTFFLHSLLMMARLGDIIDHEDCNGLNNRRNNLRRASLAENNRNSRRRTDNSSGVKGVWWCTKSQKWRAAIRAEGRRKFLGVFADLSEAATAYAKASQDFHGAFGRAEAAALRGEKEPK